MISVYYFDDPKVLKCAVTPIPASGSGTLTVIASAPTSCNVIQCVDSVGQLVGFFVGPPGSERLIGVLGGGLKELFVNIKGGQRVSVRAMENKAITSGTLFCQFLAR